MQLHKLSSLQQSFLHFHFISAVHIWFISYIINTHFFHGNIWTHNWPAPNISGFIAQLVEHRTGITRSQVQTPLKSWIFFSGLFTQLHKLHSLRRSFLHLQNFMCYNKITLARKDVLLKFHFSTTDLFQRFKFSLTRKWNSLTFPWPWRIVLADHFLTCSNHV